MYCEYWNFHKAPFDNVPDPSMYADCNLSMENVIVETIFAIKEANESFAVIIGAAGLGKTLALRMIIDSLERNKYKTVIITNPGISFTDLLREVIGQITDQPCEENRKTVLLEIFKHLLFATIDQGQKIVIFIDEANVLSPANLENLRLLTNMQGDQRNLFTLVLAGQMELAQRLEHPKRANLFQRIGSYGMIDKLPSEEAVKTYIETRLKLAGTNIHIFADDCIPVIWEYSEHGIPRLINKICKLCLKAGETNNFDLISSDIVLQIAGRFQALSKTAVQKRKPRSRPEPVEASEIAVSEDEPEEPPFTETTPDRETHSEVAEPVIQTTSPSAPKEIPLAARIPDAEVTADETQTDAPPSILPLAAQPAPEDQATAEMIPETETLSVVAEPVLQIPPEQKPEEILVAAEIPDTEVSTDEAQPDASLSTISIADQPAPDDKPQAQMILGEKTPCEIIEPILQASTEPEAVHLTARIPVPEVTLEESPQELSMPITLITAQPAPEEKPLIEAVTDPETLSEVAQPSPVEISEVNMEQDPFNDEKRRQSENDNYDEVVIGEHKIQLAIPEDILKQVKSFNRGNANKSAGFWAAQIIKQNPQLTSSPLADPVYIWNEIKDSILKKIAL
jgi:general secretion pathway protein A